MPATVSPKVAALLERGVRLMQQAEFLEAARAFERAAQQVPALGDAHAMRADALMRAGKLDAALASAERALRLRPGWGEALMLRGNIEALLERFPAAEASFRAAMAVMGPAPALQANLGNAFLEQGRFAQALQAYDLALAAHDTTALHSKRARALQGLDRPAEAEQSWKIVLERQPDSLEAIEQLCRLCMARRDLAALEAMCRRGIEVNAEAPVFHLGLGIALWWAGRHEESMRAFGAAASFAADRDAELFHEANLSLASGLLALGRWQEGWEKYQGRHSRQDLRERFPRLAPQPAALAALDRAVRIGIRAEQGIGDQLFFLRFAPLLRARGHELLLDAHPKLVPLLAGRTEIFSAVRAQDDPEPIDCDVELLMGDLPLACGTPFAPPFPLAVDEARRASLAARLRAFGPPPYLGVTWRAGLLPDERAAWAGRSWQKSVPASELGASLRSLNATVVILQRQPDPEEAQQLAAGLGREALDLSTVNDDLADALATLSLLGDYVGVSNTNMHLMAGLQGAFARVLVATPSEWRWALGMASPWFPGFKLYRQGERQQWAAALQALVRDCQKP